MPTASGRQDKPKDKPKDKTKDKPKDKPKGKPKGKPKDKGKGKPPPKKAKYTEFTSLNEVWSGLDATDVPILLFAAVAMGISLLE
jgi:hypothetical protein